MNEKVQNEKLVDNMKYDVPLMYYCKQNESNNFAVLVYGDKESGWIPSNRHREEIIKSAINISNKSKINVLVVPWYVKVKDYKKELKIDRRNETMSFIRKGVIQPILGIFKKASKEDMDVLKCIKCNKEVIVTETLKGSEIKCSCGQILKEKQN